MNRSAILSSILQVIVLCCGAACASNPPTLTLSAERVLHHGHVFVEGSGFTPLRNVSSHLQRPDGTEFPVLPILTNDQGGFSHDIDTMVLGAGIFELWVVDDTTNVSSNRVRFEVTLEPPDP
jgi:hypothetical protein